MSEALLGQAWPPEVYREDMCAMFRRALWPIPDDDGDYWLLDAGDIGPDGEWAAYIWWCSNGGFPEPYPSFGAVMREANMPPADSDNFLYSQARPLAEGGSPPLGPAFARRSASVGGSAPSGRRISYYEVFDRA